MLKRSILSPEVLSHIQALRDEVQKAVHIHSAYRSPGYNAGISGSAKWSRHMYGDAIDFHIEGEDFDKIKDHLNAFKNIENTISRIENKEVLSLTELFEVKNILQIQ